MSNDSHEVTITYRTRTPIAELLQELAASDSEIISLNIKIHSVFFPIEKDLTEAMINEFNGEDRNNDE